MGIKFEGFQIIGRFLIPELAGAPTAGYFTGLPIITEDSLWKALPKEQPGTRPSLVVALVSERPCTFRRVTEAILGRGRGEDSLNLLGKFLVNDEHILTLQQIGVVHSGGTIASGDRSAFVFVKTAGEGEAVTVLELSRSSSSRYLYIREKGFADPTAHPPGTRFIVNVQGLLDIGLVVE